MSTFGNLSGFGRPGPSTHYYGYSQPGDSTHAAQGVYAIKELVKRGRCAAAEQVRLDIAQKFAGVNPNKRGYMRSGHSFKVKDTEEYKMVHPVGQSPADRLIARCYRAKK